MQNGLEGEETRGSETSVVQEGDGQDAYTVNSHLSLSYHYVSLAQQSFLFPLSPLGNNYRGFNQDGGIEGHVAHLFPQIHKKYIYMWNSYHRITIEHY